MSIINDKSTAPDADMDEYDKYTLFFDGCSKGNPGKAGAGAVLYRTDFGQQSSRKFGLMLNLWG